MRFTAVFTGKEDDGDEERRYTDKFSFDAPSQQVARDEMRRLAGEGERLVYTGPGDFGTDLGPVRG
jgi:hypothetical protein